MQSFGTDKGSSETQPSSDLQLLRFSKLKFFFVLWQTCGQSPPDLALLSISWIVFFLESGSFLETSTGWRQRTSPAEGNTHVQMKQAQKYGLND